MWTREQALDLCRHIERIAPIYGAHIGLTGGLLYKEGPRKDCDILVYRIRQVPEIDTDGFFEALQEIGIEKTGGFGWCHKAVWDGLPMDFFFPEEDGEYLHDAKQHEIDMEFTEVI